MVKFTSTSWWARVDGDFFVRTSFFLIGFYTLSLICIVLIVKFGVLQAVNPPNSLLRGMFALSSIVAGIVGGGIAVFFWKGTKYFIGAWGGFAFALWIQCFRDGGLIRQIGFRWILYIGKAQSECSQLLAAYTLSSMWGHRLRIVHIA